MYLRWRNWKLINIGKPFYNLIKFKMHFLEPAVSDTNTRRRTRSTNLIITSSGLSFTSLNTTDSIMTRKYIKYMYFVCKYIQIIVLLCM